MPLLSAFLDSSVILSGLASPTGGSGKLLEAGKLKKVRLIANPYVVQEASYHLDKLKLELDDLENLLSNHVVHLMSDPSKQIIQKFEKITPDSNDAPIIAGSLLSRVDYLISLDKKHILIPRVKRALKPIKVVSPKEFWSSLKSYFKPSLKL